MIIVKAMHGASAVLEDEKGHAIGAWSHRHAVIASPRCPTSLTKLHMPEPCPECLYASLSHVLPLIPSLNLQCASRCCSWSQMSTSAPTAVPL